jgi:DNA-binding NtrC family response regulator
MGSSLEEAEKIMIRDTISAQQGNKSKAAGILGIGRKTLHRKLAELGAGYGLDPGEEL